MLDVAGAMTIKYPIIDAKYASVKKSNSEKRFLPSWTVRPKKKKTRPQYPKINLPKRSAKSQRHHAGRSRMPFPLNNQLLAGIPAGKWAIQFRHRISGMTESAAPMNNSKLVKVAKPNSLNAIVAKTGAIKIAKGFRSNVIAKLKTVSKPKKIRSAK